MLLHGFGGTGAAWDAVRGQLPAETYRPLAPDLPGHGAAAARRPCTIEACVEYVLALAPDRFALAGYSMGGRVALALAVRAPERVSALGLVATTAGIADPAGRAARRTADEELAAWIAGHDLEAFADRWLAQPLFAEDPPTAQQAARADIARNTTEGLAASLRQAGTGAMAPLWEHLEALTMPVTVVVGERDARFRALGDRLVAAIPAARTVVVPGAGHALPRAAPGAVAAALTT